MATQPIKIAVMALGGEGGGVLADWIVDLGEGNGHLAQATSVPGVAQRTGATIYYVELYPRAQAEADGAAPVFALMPLPGDVDIVLASELMEAARAVQRGLVTPERTTLIGSTHRVYAIAEKVAMGDGRADPAHFLAAAEAAAKRFVGFDMARTAQDCGSVISAVLFGALAGAGVLPFSRAQFEATIARGGVGVGASMKAFAAAYDRAQQPPASEAPEPALPAFPALAAPPATGRDPQVQALLDRIGTFDGAARPMVAEGVRRAIDYQDPAYATLYLERVAKVAALGDAALTSETARHLALWMTYEDTIRVAQLKTRGSRFDRVRREVRVGDGQLLAIDEYLHPRLQEIRETLPGWLGRWVCESSLARRLVERLTRRGRIVTTSSLRGFLLLRTVAGMRRWRRTTLRYAEENSRIEAWLNEIDRAAATDPLLAIEVARCQRLVKGYSDTHERGLRNYDAVIGVLRRGPVAPATLRELRDAALADEHGHALQAALARHP